MKKTLSLFLCTRSHLTRQEVKRWPIIHTHTHTLYYHNTSTCPAVFIIRYRSTAIGSSSISIQASVACGFKRLCSSARHSNKFDVSVNIAAGNNVTFNLIYQELLRRRFGAYEHSVFVNPSANVRQYSVEVFIQERTEIRDVRTPAMRKDIINNAVEEGEKMPLVFVYNNNNKGHLACL